MNLGHRSTPPVHSDHASCNPPVKRQAANDLTLKNRARNICPPAGQIVSALPTEMATACVMRNLTSSPMPTSSRSPKNEMGSRPARYRPRARRSTGGPAVTGCWSVSKNLRCWGVPKIQEWKESFSHQVDETLHRLTFEGGISRPSWHYTKA